MPLPNAHIMNMVTMSLYFLTFTIYGLSWSSTVADMPTSPLPLGGLTKVGDYAANWSINVLVTATVILCNVYWFFVTKRFLTY